MSRHRIPPTPIAATAPAGRGAGVAATFAALALAGALLVSGRHDRQAERRVTESRTTAAAERRIRDLDIEFFGARVSRDPSGALDPIRLGGLLLDRGRETGNPADFAETVTLARRSILNGRRDNPAAWQLLVSALAAEHRFSEALAAADTLVEIAVGTATARAVRAEMLLENGRYAAADSAFRLLWVFRNASPVGTRIARWAEVEGRPWIAERILSEFDSAATANELSSVAARTWLRVRLADLLLRAGRTAEASRWAAKAERDNPDDPRVLAIAARVALASGRPGEAIERAERAAAVRPDPATFAILAEASDRLGDRARTTQFLGATAATLGLGSTGFHRGAALLLLDHGIEVDAIRAAAERDVAGRPDGYGLDLLAWALFRSGRRADAASAIRRAIGINPTDPVFRRHANAILGSEGR